jgi:hypothetical protein
MLGCGIFYSLISLTRLGCASSGSAVDDGGNDVTIDAIHKGGSNDVVRGVGARNSNDAQASG